MISNAQSYSPPSCSIPASSGLSLRAYTEGHEVTLGFSYMPADPLAGNTSEPQPSALVGQLLPRKHALDHSSLQQTPHFVIPAIQILIFLCISVYWIGDSTLLKQRLLTAEIQSTENRQHRRAFLARIKDNM